MAEKYDQELLKVTTTEFRVSHPHLFKPSQMMRDGRPLGEPAYSIEMLFDKSKTDLKTLQAPIHHACIAKWGKDKSKWPTPLKMPIRDGDKPHGKKKEVKPEHAGQWVVKASSKGEYQAPPLVDQKVQPIINQADFYPGCYGRAALKAFAYEMSEDAVGVKFILDGVQKTKDGVAIGGRKSADQIFGALESNDFEDFGPSQTEDDEIPF